MSSSSLQQVLLPCTGCNAFLSHESSISTPTLGRARSTRRRLLLYTALLLPRAHTVETEVVPRNRDHGSCELSSFFPLSSAFFLQSMCFGLLTNLDLMIIVISCEANPKSGDNLCKMQYLIILASILSTYMI